MTARTMTAPTPLQHLHRLHDEYYQREYPSLPSKALPRTKYTERTTNGLTKMVRDYIHFSGGLVERINTVGRQIKAKSGKQIWIPTSGIRGSADLSATYRGLSLKVEIKCAATRDRMTDEQVRYGERVRRAGGHYCVVTRFDEFYEWFMGLGGNDKR